MTAQQEFDNKYITSSEICQVLGIHRCTVLLAIRTGRLPEGIIIRRPNGVPQIQLWERDVVAPILVDWSKDLVARKGA